LVTGHQEFPPNNILQAYELPFPAKPAYVQWPNQELGKRGELGDSAVLLFMNE